jgi:hypothetical protein
MQITAAGNIGVQQTPVALSGIAPSLQVFGQSSALAGHIVAVSSASDSSVGLYSGITSADNPALVWQNSLRLGTVTNTGVGGFAERMRLTSTGEVGINLTTVPAKFAVNGGTTITAIADWNSKANSVFQLANPAVRFGIGYDAADAPILQAFDTSNVARTLYLNKYGGSVVVGAGGSLITDGSGNELGYRDVPPDTTLGNGAALTLAQRGKSVVGAYGSLVVNTGVFSRGHVIAGYNDQAGAMTMTQGAGFTLRLHGTATTGSRTIGGRGFWSMYFNSGTEAIMMGDVT